MPRAFIGPDQLSRLSPDIDVTGFKPGRYPLPDFLIVGPQRTGSSWLRTNLCRHPQILMPFKKEIFFFSHLRRKDHKRYVSNRIEPYSALFHIPFFKQLERAGKALRHGLILPPTLRGEATASYATLAREDIANIFVLNPAAKIILIVRDPRQRAWSHAKKTLARDRGLRVDAVPFSEYEDYYRSRESIARGSYCEMIHRWQEFCQPGALHIARYDLLVSDPLQFLTQVHEFLGVASGEKFARPQLFEVVNPTSSDTLPAAHRQLLDEIFAPEIERLNHELGISFAGE